jgi:ribosomal protein S18 acetylase RimI-like enzyme
MTSPRHGYEIRDDSSHAHPSARVDRPVTDDALTALLEQVYVQGGFTPGEVARTLFAAAAVRARGRLLTAHDLQTAQLVGTIIVVGPDAPALQLSEQRAHVGDAPSELEAELQLLAVHPDARGRGLGKALVEAGVAHARARGWQRIVLSTQPRMQAARAIYEACGFTRLPARDWSRMGRDFLVYGLSKRESEG